MLELDERTLIDAARDGSVDAFEHLYRLHSGRVYGLCLRISKNDAEAQDCAQETFVTAWQRLSTFRRNSALSTWLHRIAVNVVLSRRRKAATESRHLAVIESEPNEDAAPPGDLEALEQAIKGLPERTREAFVLQKIYGYTHEEVAAMLDVAVGTSKALVHRARRLLGEALESGDSADSRSGADFPNTGRDCR